VEITGKDICLPVSKIRVGDSGRKVEQTYQLAGLRSSGKLNMENGNARQPFSMFFRCAAEAELQISAHEGPFKERIDGKKYRLNVSVIS